MKIEAAMQAKAPATISQLFEQGRPVPGAIVNKDLGALALPKGVAVTSSVVHRFFFYSHGQVTHWTDPQLRHKNRLDQCDRLPTDKRDACLRLLDPLLAKQDCPNSDLVHTTLRDVISEYRADYEGAYNLQLARAVLDSTCQDDISNCAFDVQELLEGKRPQLRSYRQTNPLTQSTDPPLTVPMIVAPYGHTANAAEARDAELEGGRTKRFIFALAAIVVGGLAATGAALASWALVRTDGLQAQIDQIAQTMRSNENSLKALLDGVQELRAADNEQRETKGVRSPRALFNRQRWVRKDPGARKISGIVQGRRTEGPTCLTKGELTSYLGTV